MEHMIPACFSAFYHIFLFSETQLLRQADPKSIPLQISLVKDLLSGYDRYGRNCKESIIPTGICRIVVREEEIT